MNITKDRRVRSPGLTLCSCKPVDSAVVCLEGAFRFCLSNRKSD